MTAIRYAAAFLCTAVLLALSACAPESSERSLFAMDTYMTFTAYGKNSEKALNDVCADIDRLEKLFSVTDSESEIGRINSSNGEPVTVSDETAKLIARSADIGRQTDGAFDITLYAVSKEWGFTMETDSLHVPDDETIKRLLKSSGSDKLSVFENTVTVTGGAQTDLGGIAKGYAAGRAAEILEQNGVESAILSLGGNIRAVGSKPDGSPWIVGIKDPENTSQLAASVSATDRAVVTSGGYERFFEANGKVYCHIIDPKTGYPVQSDILSATVIGCDDALCDALSTAFVVMGQKKSAEYLNTHTDTDAVLITADHTIYVTKGISEAFSLIEKKYHSEQL